MKLYGKRFVKNYVQRKIKSRSETSDGILWDIDTNTYTCRVRIEGGSEYVVAHYPRNWKEIPYWLKAGNAVRILHRAGVRGYTEVIGEGRAISSGAMPSLSTPVDVVLTGGAVTQTETPSMYVSVSSGTVRINGSVYPLTASELTTVIVMDDPAPMTMGDAYLMGITSYSVALDAAPAEGYFRYDLIYVCADGVVSYTAGTPATSNPVQPTVPADCVQLGSYILVQGGVNAVYDYNIGQEYSTRNVAYLGVVLSSDELSWSLITDTPYVSVTVTCRDQYGASINVSGEYVRLSIISGEGQLYHASFGYGNPVTVAINTSTTFRYYRDQTASETNPVILQADLLIDTTGITGNALLTLLDSGGLPI